MRTLYNWTRIILNAKKSLFPRTISTQKPLILEKIIVRGCLSYGFRGKIHRMAILELFILELFRLKLYRRWNLIEWSYRRFDVSCEQVYHSTDWRLQSNKPLAFQYILSTAATTKKTAAIVIITGIFWVFATKATWAPRAIAPFVVLRRSLEQIS